jgi:Fe-S cluster assembly protein SufD
MKSFAAEARERFLDLRWPDPADETWRRTDLSRLDLDAIAQETRGGTAGFGMRPLEEKWKRAGIRHLSLEEAMRERGDELETILREGIEGTDKPAAWHYSALSGGSLVCVPAGVEMDEPIVLDYEAGGSSRLTSPHLFVLLGSGARASVVVRIGASGADALTNLGVDLRLEPGAALGFGLLQTLGPAAIDFSRLRSRLERDSSLRSLDARLGGRVVVSTVDCLLDGPGSEAYLDGAYYCPGNRHMDMRTVQRHRSPRATSKACYKSAVESGGRGVFQGLIEVEKGASGTDAYLANRNLVLGPAARSDSIPTLRIGNDDVRCSHGSTTGRLSEEELFYLRSRGFPEAEARALLVSGFFDEVLARAPDGIGEEAAALIGARLGAGLGLSLGGTSVHAA